MQRLFWSLARRSSRESPRQLSVVARGRRCMRSPGHAVVKGCSLPVGQRGRGGAGHRERDGVVDGFSRRGGCRCWWLGIVRSGTVGGGPLAAQFLKWEQHLKGRGGCVCGGRHEGGWVLVCNALAPTSRRWWRSNNGAAAGAGGFGEPSAQIGGLALNWDGGGRCGPQFTAP